MTLAFVRIRTPPEMISKSTLTLVIGRGWHSGMRSGVRFAAMMPATRATWSASPLLVPSRTASSVGAAIRTMHSAVASRTVAALSATSTIRAAPFSSTWVNLFAIGHQDMRMGDVHGVLFDYGRTLVTFRYPTDDLLRVLDEFRPRIERALGIPAPQAETMLEDVLHPLEEYIASMSEDEVDYMDVYRETWRRAGLVLPDDLLHEILDEEQQCWDRAVEVDGEAVRVLTWLRDRGIKSGVCSNAPFPPAMMRRQVASNGITELVDAVVFSSEIGRRKPAPEVYRAAIDAIGTAAAETVFVG